MAPLYNEVKGKPSSLKWTPALDKALNTTKAVLADATLLQYPISNKELILTTDASDDAIGGVLEQIITQGLRPLVFSG